MLESFFPLPIILFIIDPLVQPLAICLPIFKVSNVGIPISVSLITLAFSLVVNKFPFIQSFVLVLHNSLPMSLPIYVLAHVNSIWIPLDPHILVAQELLEVQNLAFQLLYHDPNMLNFQFINADRLEEKVLIGSNGGSGFVHFL